MATIDPTYLVMLRVKEIIEKSLDDNGNPTKPKKQYIEDLTNKIHKLYVVNMEQCVKYPTFNDNRDKYKIR